VVSVPLLLEFLEGDVGGLDSEEIDPKNHCVDEEWVTSTIVPRYCFQYGRTPFL
jgi:hypothetical protein